jgi:hypothetical protein
MSEHARIDLNGPSGGTPHMGEIQQSRAIFLIFLFYCFLRRARCSNRMSENLAQRPNDANLQESAFWGFRH